MTDRYDREPIHLLIKVFIFGMLSIIPAIIIEMVFGYFNIFSGLWRAAYTAFIVAGFSEELVKRMVVLKIAFRHPAFDEKLDGIVYAVFASLGFATIENVMYVVFRYANVGVGIQRAIFSVPAHMLFAITMGYYLSLAKYAEEEGTKKFYFSMSLIVPIVLHGIYDYILMSKHEVLLMLFIPFVIFLWAFNLKRLNIYYRESKEFYRR